MIGTYSGIGGPAYKTNRHIFVIDKKSSRLVASKSISLQPPESITRNNKGRVEEHFSKETKEWNSEQKKQEKAFFKSLF